jgi:hypothetical protein
MHDTTYDTPIVGSLRNFFSTEDMIQYSIFVHISDFFHLVFGWLLLL